MFYKFKRWSEQLMDHGNRQSVELRKEFLRQSERSHNPPTTSGSATSASANIPQLMGDDPRELPRPVRCTFIQSTKESADEHTCFMLRQRFLKFCYMNGVSIDKSILEKDDQCMAVNNKACTCTNCTSLPLLIECGICYESLQGRNVHSCQICSNVTCISCASKVDNCPFCRTTRLFLPNIALQRLIDRLALPCKNSRSGCTELVPWYHRSDHEAICNYGPFGCPIGNRICRWHGDFVQIEDHFRIVHNLQPIINDGITVEISGFRDKAYAFDGRQYAVCLSCHDNLYVIKIVLFQGKLKLSVSQMTSIDDTQKCMASSNPGENYGAWVNVSSISKVLTQVLPFEKKNYDTQEVEIPCHSIISRKENIFGSTVKINVAINPITDT